MNVDIWTNSLIGVEGNFGISFVFGFSLPPSLFLSSYSLQRSRPRSSLLSLSLPPFALMAIYAVYDGKSFLTDGIGLNLFGFEGVREFGNQASQRKADFLLHSDLRFENNRRHYRCQFRSVKTCYLELSFGSVAAWGYQATKCTITVGCCLFFSYFTDLTPCFS